MYWRETSAVTDGLNNGSIEKRYVSKIKAWSPGARSRLFHSECPTCPSTCAGSLCMVCRHLRLRHIVRCYLGPFLSENPSHPRCLQFQLGTVGELRKRSLYCEMCRMLVQPVHLDRKIEPDFTVDLFVFLDIRFLGPKYRVVIELVIDKEKNCLMVKSLSSVNSCNLMRITVRGLHKKRTNVPIRYLIRFSGYPAYNVRFRVFFGLPFSGFYVALPWRTQSGQYFPRDGRQNIFPSWSWAATQGEVELLYPKSGAILRLKDHFAGPLAMWAVPDVDTGKPRIIRYQSGGSGPSFLTRSSTLLSAVMAYKAGCYPGDPHPELETDRTWKQYDELLHKLWPSYDDFFNDALVLLHPDHAQHDLLINHISKRFEHIGKAGMAYIYTQSLRVRAVLSHQSRGYFPNGTMELQTELGDSIGWLFPRTIAYGRLFDLQNPSPEIFFDALALSLGAICLTGFDGHEVNEVCCYDCEGVPMKFQSHFIGSVVDLMIVDTRDGVSTRIALGRAFLRIWANASPKSQSFILV